MDELIKRIADEVIKRLNNRPKKALVLITGGAIGYKEAAEAITRLKSDGWNIDVLVSQAALRIFGEDTLKADLNVEKIYHEDVKHDINGLWKDADQIIIAELTTNSAAKIAAGICDNELLTIVKNAIMSGKEIIAALDGACPDNKVRAEMGMDKAPKAYHDLLHDNLVKLATYGIWLCNAQDLYETCSTGVESIKKKKKTAKADPPAEANKPVVKENTQKVFINKHVVSRRDIYENRHYKNILIPADSLLTHSASDLADELGIKINRR